MGEVGAGGSAEVGVVTHPWISLVFPSVALSGAAFGQFVPGQDSGLGLGFGGDSLRSFSAASSLLAQGVGTPWG